MIQKVCSSVTRWEDVFCSYIGGTDGGTYIRVNNLQIVKWVAPCENVSTGICGQRRPRSAQSDQGLCCPLTESVDTTECINGEQRPG